MLKRSIPWTFQPPPGVGPNPYWIKKGLVALFDCRQARELISGDFATNKSSLLPATPTSKGQAADFSGTVNQQYAHRAAYAVTGAITIAAYLEIDALTNYTPIISKGSSSTSNVPYEFRIGQTVTGGEADLIRAKASDVREQFAPSSVVSAGFKGLLVVSSPNGLVETTPTLTANGVKTSLSSTFQPAITGPCVDAGAAVWVARRSDGATQFDGRIYYIPLFNVALSDEDKKYLLDNPWSIYAPQQRNIYVIVASGSPSGVGSAAITFSASGVGGALFNGVGSTAITFTNSGVGKSLAASVGSSAITFDASGVGTYLAGSDGAGAASISFTASGVGRSTSAAIGAASISFNASAIGTYPGAGVLTPAVGSATMSLNATGYGNALQSYTWNDITYSNSTWTDIQPPSDIWTDIITP